MDNQLEKAIMAATDLPSIPAIAVKVMQLVEDEATSAEEIAKVISADPGVAARVLKISNSAFYGCQREIKTLSAAIVMLGLNTLKTLVVAASLKQMYKRFDALEQMLWEHSLGAALAAYIIAINTRLADKEEAFMAGLFHDIGKLIMLSLDRVKYQEAVQRCQTEGIAFKEAEHTLFQFHHDAVGAFVTKKWNFPDTLVKAIRYHHLFDSIVMENDLYQTRLTGVVAIADMFCLKLGIGQKEPQQELNILESRPVKLFKIEEARLDRLLEMFGETFERDKGHILS